MIIIYSQQPLVYSTYIKFENNKSYKDSLRFLLAATIVGATSGVRTAFIIVGFQSNSCDIVVGVVSGVVGCGISGDGGGGGGESSGVAAKRKSDRIIIIEVTQTSIPEATQICERHL